MSSVRLLRTLGNPRRSRKSRRGGRGRKARRRSRRNTFVGAAIPGVMNPRRRRRGGRGRRVGGKRKVRRSRRNPRGGAIKNPIRFGRLNVKGDMKAAPNRLVELAAVAGAAGLLTIASGWALGKVADPAMREKANWGITGGLIVGGLLTFSFLPVLATGAVLAGLFSVGRIAIGKVGGETGDKLLALSENKRAVDVEGVSATMQGLGKTSYGTSSAMQMARGRNIPNVAAVPANLNGLVTDARRSGVNGLGATKLNPVAKRLGDLVNDQKRARSLGDLVSDKRRAV